MSIIEAYDFGRKDLPKFLIIFLAISIICFFFPREKIEIYKYNAGNKWAYPDMVTESDFSIGVASEINSDSIVNYTYEEGSRIIRNGQEVTPTMKKIIDGYLEENRPSSPFFSPSNLLKFFGYFILTTLIILALIIFASKYYPELCRSISGISFLVIWPVLFGALAFMVSKSSALSPYLIPFCIVPIVVFNFWGPRLAFMVHVVVILIASFLSGLGYDFTFLQILAGMVTVLIISETRYWNKFFRWILIIMGTYLLGYLGLAIINSGTVSPNEYPIFGWLAVNSILLLLAYPFVPIVEKIFGFVSSITLAELTDMNNPLLKELSIKAPGTLQHSLQVSNLSEAAAEKIGANSLLLKAAALYHDIGKVKQPEYYIENSQGANPHDALSAFDSGRIIIEHVTEGIKMAKKNKLPKVLIDFIETHHGTTRVEYFYRKQKEAEPDREFDESLFRYPGPKPTTKEQTILMLADSIEAASKSLKNPTGQDIDNLVDNIVAYKIKEDQLTDSNLSFAELESCMDKFKAMLRSIYHVRVEYPSESPQ